MISKALTSVVCAALIACSNAGDESAVPIAESPRASSRLVLTLDTGDSLVLDENSTEGGQLLEYRVVDSLFADRFYLVEYTGPEIRGVLAISRRSGTISPIASRSTFAPTGQLFVGTHWDDGGFEPTRIAVYRLGTDTLAAEWEVLPFGWGPDSVRWTDDSSAVVWRTHTVSDSLQGTTLTPFLLRWRAGVWSLDSSARAP